MEQSKDVIIPMGEEWARPDPALCLKFSSRAYIHRVRSNIRRENEDRYEPHTVSIGPYHRGKPMEFMEVDKQRYLESFYSRSKSPNTILTDVEARIEEVRDDARKSYFQSIDYLSDTELNRMLILDGCFIIEYLCRDHEYNYNRQNLISSSPLKEDDMSHRRKSADSVRSDLVLLENQIPFSVLKCLFDLINSPLLEDGSTVVSTLDDLITKFYYPTVLLPISSSTNSRHLLDNLRKRFKGPPDHSPSPGVYEGTSCATDLHDAGVNFTKNNNANLLDITFSNGNFEIPSFCFKESWITLLHNIVALEQCCRNYKDEVTSYAFLMDSLINSPMDVRLLRAKKIISSSNMREDDITSAVKSLCKNNPVDDFYYLKLCCDVNGYSKTTYSRWRAGFLSNFIRNPQRGLYPTCILLLTLTQTVVTVLSWLRQKESGSTNFSHS